MIAAIDDIITTAIGEHVFPGAVVLVARHGEVAHFAAYGTTMYADSGAWPVACDTIYDIASLTKVFTATAALRLIDADAVALDVPAARYLPGLRSDVVTVRHLLTHTSGLHLQLSTLRQHPPDRIRAILYATLPVDPPGTRIAYTNINSLLLGDIVATVYGAALEVALADLVLHPLGLHNTCFRPTPELREHIAPTERDQGWRGALVQGVVHDESAYALGGVAGHAGLFSTAADLERFTRMWLNGGSLAEVRLLRPETVALSIRDHTVDLAISAHAPPTSALACGLGWMLKRPNFMGRAAGQAYGHTGFTGPVLVLIPDHDLAVILLSNRTYPQRTLPAHHGVTAAVVHAVMTEMHLL